jgi:hypothetical protein
MSARTTTSDGHWRVLDFDSHHAAAGSTAGEVNGELATLARP